MADFPRHAVERCYAMSEVRWVTCSREASFSVSQTRHLILRNGDGLTTLCGATASHQEVWRNNATKPTCEGCKKRGWSGDV